ncbi:MAG TPA: DUF2271 domain-containing protein [bacterium]|nr:DUF2271 domain-containing protein [bacterium]HRQ70750.1 DUF2271 domain-containing protein [bacterium]
MRNQLILISLLTVIFAGCDNFDRTDFSFNPDSEEINDTNLTDDAVDTAVTPDETAIPDETVAPDNTVTPDETVVPDENNTPIPVTMSLSVTTTSYNGSYAPRNVFAVWIEKEDGSYIKTLGAWARNYKSKLQRWASKSNYGSNGMVDAVTGASRMNHNPVPELTWKIDDIAFQPAENGIYNVYFELNETNSGSKSTTAKIQISESSEVIKANNTTNIKDIQITFK